MTTLRQRMISEMKLRGFSEHTQRAYLLAVRGLAKHYMRSPDTIKQAEIEAYIVYLRDRGLAQKTCQLAAAGIKFFFNQALGDHSKIIKLPPVRTEHRLPEVLSRREVERLFTCTANLKHRALLMTTYSGGLRVSEVTHLRISDIESDRMMIRVRQGKGKKDRYTMLSKRLLNVLRAYWMQYQPQEWLFFGQTKDAPMGSHSALSIYHKAKKRAGIKTPGGIHTLRHCFATHMIEVYNDPVTIQKLMGHRSIRTTLQYVHVSRTLVSKIKSPLDLPQSPSSRSTDTQS